MKMKSVMSGLLKHRLHWNYDRDLRDHATGHYVALKHVGAPTAQGRHAFLDARTARSFRPITSTSLHGLVHHLTNFV
jgi:hypothetical protein